jgi:hypothetical protein
MTCAEEFIQIQDITLLFLCIQVIVLIISFFDKRNGFFDFLLPIVLIAFHPRFLKEENDCGSDLLKTSALFLVAAVGLFFWTKYRGRILERIQEKE